MSKILNSPSVSLYKVHENQIRKVREALFTELDHISSDFSIEARNILEEKLNSNSGKPLMGELFPWIIKDLVNADTNNTYKISVGWLAMYLYTLFLDEYVDDPKPLSSKKFLTGAILAKTGLLKISKFTNNTPYEKYIDEALSYSARSQSLDTELQKKITKTSIKTRYSEGKNYVILACAGALAASNSKHGKFITEFTSTLLLTLQFLDDLSDYKEDFRMQNFTVLLNDTFQKSPKFKSKLKEITNRELLEELIITGALFRVINKIHTLLNQSMRLIQKNDIKSESSKSSLDFFVSLQTSISSFRNFLTKARKSYISDSEEKRNLTLDKTEEYIAIIAQST